MVLRDGSRLAPSTPVAQRARRHIVYHLGDLLLLSLSIEWCSQASMRTLPTLAGWGHHTKSAHGQRGDDDCSCLRATPSSWISTCSMEPRCVCLKAPDIVRYQRLIATRRGELRDAGRLLDDAHTALQLGRRLKETTWAGAWADARWRAGSRANDWSLEHTPEGCLRT